MLYDVIVVGAGPAGSYLSYLLSKVGIKVCLIDKAQFPRKKVCGGGISHKTIELIEFDITPVIQRKIIGAYLTYQNQDTVVKDLAERGGAAVVREEFDNYILEMAKQAGATFIGGCSFEAAMLSTDHVQVTTSKGLIEARYLVGADGVFSAVRNKLFGKELVTYAPAMEALVKVPTKVLDQIGDRMLFDFGGMPKGYGWIFPKKDHLNIGVFSIYPAKDIRNDLHTFMKYYSCLRSAEQIDYLGFSIPLKNVQKKFQMGNVWLIGDAAGFAESFYGEGIYFALKSAHLASEAMVSQFDHPRNDIYTNLVKKDLYSDLAYSELNARMFFPIQKFGFYWMVRNQHVNYYFAELIAGNVGHKECFYKTILTSPYWLFSKNFPPYDGPAF